MEREVKREEREREREREREEGDKRKNMYEKKKKIGLVRSR